MDNAYKYKVMFETLELGIIFYGADGNITDINSTAEKIIGITKEEILNIYNTSKVFKIIKEDGSICSPDEYPSTISLKTQFFKTKYYKCLII